MKELELHMAENNENSEPIQLDNIDFESFEIELFDNSDTNHCSTDENIEPEHFPALHEQVPEEFRALATEVERKHSRRKKDSSLDFNYPMMPVSTYLDRNVSKWLIRREHQEDEFRQLLENNGAVLLTASTGSGKSHFIRTILLEMANLEKSDIEFTIIDCFNLRMKSPRIIEFDAACGLYEGRDEALRVLLNSIGDASPIEHILSSLSSQKRQIICFEHIEFLSNDIAVVNWFTNLVIMLTTLKMKVVFVGACDQSPHLRMTKQALIANNKSLASMKLNHFSQNEVMDWWQRLIGIEAKDYYFIEKLFELTGGSPLLLRDFGRYVESRASQHNSNKSLLEGFAGSQSKFYSRELEVVIDVFLENNQRICKSISEITSPKTIKKLLATDNFVLSGARLKFKSKLLELRYENLAKRAEISSCKGQYSKLGGLLNFQELVSDNLCNRLFREETSNKVFSALSGILRQQGIKEVSVYTRDIENSRLWLRKYTTQRDITHANKERVLNFQDWPDFSVAVDSGRIVYKNHNDLFLPLQDHRLRVSILIYCELGPEIAETDSYEKRLRLRAIWNLLQKLQPAIAGGKLKLEAHRDRHAMTSNRYRSMQFLRAKSDTKQIKTLLENLNCLSIVVLERGLENWSVALDKVYYRSKKDLNAIMKLFEGAKTKKLDQIAQFPSKGSLLLGDKKLHNVFPRISVNENFSVFIMPTKETTVIGFVVSKETAKRFDTTLKERFEQLGWLAVA